MRKKDKYRKIYDHYVHDMYNYIFFIVDDSRYTEKIIIEVFEDVFVDINFFMNIEKKMSWVKKIAKEKIIEIMRREKKYFYFNEYKKEKHLAKINFEKVSKEQIIKVINKLKVEERYVLYEVYYENISLEECAENLMVEVEVIKRMINKIQDRIDIERGKYIEK